MKKLVLFIFALMLSISISAQEKKTFEGAIAQAGLTKAETVKAMEIQKEKMAKLKVIRKEDLTKEEKKEKMKEVRKASSAKLRKLLGKEKMKAINLYWKKN